jgi:hypothetical protein
LLLLLNCVILIRLTRVRGGPGVISVDELMESGGELTQLAPETLKKLDAVLPLNWSHGVCRPFASIC